MSFLQAILHVVQGTYIKRGLMGMCRKALERTDARVLRLMFAMAPWERPMTYTDGETEAEAWGEVTGRSRRADHQREDQ